jgi:hypothetical protein
MFHFGLKRNQLFFKISALACGLACILVFLHQAQAGTRASDDLSLDNGFRHLYNLDFESAHKTFEAWQEQHPDDPMGAASNAAAYLFAEFDRLHVLELSRFIDNKKFDEKNKFAADLKVKAAFEAELAKADDLAGKVLAQSSDDPNALLARTLSDGMRADYAVLIAQQTRAGLNFLKSSRSLAEKLIRIDPDCHDAYLALGIENYILGLRSAPTRWMLRLSGAQTDKDKGIEYLKITAEKGRYLGPYARLLLAIAALRDQDKTTAKKLLSDLAREFPQNRLYQIELARLRS